MDRAVCGLTAGEVEARPGAGSSFAWTVAHATNQLDAWLNVRFAGHEPHPLIGRNELRIGGSGSALDWQGIRAAVAEARAKARRYLESRSDADLDFVLPYDGSMLVLRETGISLQHALLRITAHHYFHIGEIATKRDLLGDQAGDYPGLLTDAI